MKTTLQELLRAKIAARQQSLHLLGRSGVDYAVMREYLEADVARWQGILTLLEQSRSEAEFNRLCWQAIGGSADMRVVTDLIAQARQSAPLGQEPPAATRRRPGGSRGPRPEKPLGDFPALRQALDREDSPMTSAELEQRLAQRQRFIVNVYARPAQLRGSRYAVGPFDSLEAAHERAEVLRQDPAIEVAISELRSA
ncbi:MAG: hypothetical protein WCA89_12235 [Terracidiphilus sp.]